jgi:hypothetical protein
MVKSKDNFKLKNERRKTLYNSGSAGHKEGRKLRRQAWNGAFGDKAYWTEANLELMRLGTLKDAR